MLTSTDTLHNIANHQHYKKMFTSLMTSQYRLDQINRVITLTNSNPYKLALTKLQGSLNKMISSYPPTLDWNRIKELLHYNFGSVTTKQHGASMLVDQQQKPIETLQEYVQTFSNLLPKSSGLLPHQAKDLAHITHIIGNLHNQKLQD